MQEQENTYSDIPIMQRHFLYFYDDDYGYIPGTEGWHDIPIGKKASNATTQRPPAFYKAKYNPAADMWYEAATQEEITEILNKGRYGEPTNEDLLMLQIAELYEEKLEQQVFNDTVLLALVDLYERGLQ